MNNKAVYIDTITEGMEKLILSICPEEIDLHFLNPKYGKKGDPAECAFILASVAPVTKAMIESAPELKLIQSCGAGFNNVDMETAVKRGVIMANAAGQNNTSTAEMAIALMLACYRRLSFVDRRVKLGEWHTFTYRHDSYELRGKTVGVIGSGACGKAVMERLAGWMVNILYYDPIRMSPENEAKYNAKYVDLDTLFRESDIVSLHCPLTKETRGLVNMERIKTMKPTSIIINEARGAVINEPDLIQALEEGLIWGAGLDCWEKEPLDVNNPLLKMDKVITTSHLGAATKETVERVFSVAFGNVLRVYHGERPINIVNGL